MVMALGPEKKERNVKGDRCYLARDPPTVKLVFSLKHMNGKLLIAKNLPWVDETYPFYRELEVGLLVRIHHHHG